MRSRVGIFEVSEDMEDRQYWFGIMDLDIIAWAKNPESFSMMVHGISPLFDEIPDGDMVPKYSVTFHRANGGDALHDYATVRRLDA